MEGRQTWLVLTGPQESGKEGALDGGERGGPPQEKPDRAQPWDVGQGFTLPLLPLPARLSPFVFPPLHSISHLEVSIVTTVKNIYYRYISAK